MSAPTREVYQLDPGARLQLIVLDASSLGDTLYYFHAGTNQLRSAVVWQGQVYQPWPVKIDGLEIAGKGAQPRPTISVANIDTSSTLQERTLGSLVRRFQDLVGAQVRVKYVYARYLDAVNFPGNVNPTADPTTYDPDEVFEIERKASETSDALVFELALPSDVAGQRIPARLIQATICGLTNDNTDICPYVATCDRHRTSCDANYGANNPLPFFAFEGSNRLLG